MGKATATPKTVQVRIMTATANALDRYLNSFKKTERPKIQDVVTEAVDQYLVSQRKRGQ